MVILRLICTHVKEGSCDIAHHLDCDSILLELIVHVVVGLSEDLGALSVDLVLLELVLERLLKESLVRDNHELVYIPVE